MVQSPDSGLRIRNFSPDQLQHAAYYVRLGDNYFRPTEFFAAERRAVSPTGALRLPLGHYVRITTLEEFSLGGSVLGIVGGVSLLVDSGLVLVSGQFIDPLYPGDQEYAPLAFGLKNLGDADAGLESHCSVAKVCFFDISDTPDIELDPESIAARTYQDRKLHAGDARLKSF